MTTIDTPRTTGPPPLRLRLPGAPPLQFDAGPRSALVIAPHPGDAMVGFVVGVHAMLAAGWRVQITSLLRDPAASDEVLCLLRRAEAGLQAHGTLLWHHLQSDPASASYAASEVVGVLPEHDLVAVPAGGGYSVEHDMVTGAITSAAVVPVVRYLLPGHAVGPVEEQRLRRVSGIRSELRPLLALRDALRPLLPCLDPLSAVDEGDLAITSDLVLV
jgi:hypothetical protein